MHAADTEDVALIQAIQAGSAGAFEGLVKRHLRRAHGIAANLVKNRDDAMDLAQDAFFKAYRALDRFDTKQRFFPWFYRILRNTCVSFLKRRGLVRMVSMNARAGGADGDELEFELVDERAVPAHAILAGCELRDEFWRAFETLPLRDREILALRHFQDLAYQDIADALEIPIGTVMSRLFHARRRLRERLEPHL